MNDFIWNHGNLQTVEWHSQNTERKAGKQNSLSIQKYIYSKIAFKDESKIQILLDKEWKTLLLVHLPVLQKNTGTSSGYRKLCENILQSQETEKKKR